MHSTLELFQPVLDALTFLLRFWWIWLGPLSLALFMTTWLNWRQYLYKQSIEWTLLELKMPREVRKGPIAMEQFFSAIYGLRNIAGDLIEKYFDGEVTLWFSFELVSFGGEIHFYIRTPSKHAGVVSANLYANYPTLEIEKVPDYIDRFPATIS